jgi:hypothetical protein
MVPRVLITHTLLWPNAARLVTAFDGVGCRAQVLCRRSHPALRLSSLERGYIYNPFAPLRSLRTAIEEANPDLIIPCDDQAVVELHQLYNAPVGSRLSSRRIRDVIERSLGKSKNYEPVVTRSELTTIAMAAGVRVPSTEVIATITQLRRWLCREGLPAVLKADFTSGGDGVAIIHNKKELAAGFKKVANRQSFIMAVGALGLKFDPHLLRQRLLGPKPKLSVQTLVFGKLANCAVACWHGTVIAGIAVEVVATQNPTAHATVVRVVDGREMLEAASRIVNYLGMSGFCGFDFVIEETTGLVFLIEINPRATQINHLALGKGRNLPAALRARVTGEPIDSGPAVTDRDVIALFPQEGLRNQDSNFLMTDYHDIPSEPELLRFYLRSRRVMTGSKPTDSGDIAQPGSSR